MPLENLALRQMPVGGEISGLAPGDELDPEVRDFLYAAWLRSGILLFHDIESSDRHLALSRCFGDLEIHPIAHVRCEDNPLLIEIGGGKRQPAYVYDETDILVNRIVWHRDTAYTPDICKGSMLRMVEVPAVGGETLFADTALAYRDLPTDVRRRLEGLEYKASLRLTPIEQTRPGAFWKTCRRATVEEDPQGGGVRQDNAATKSRHPSVVHPAVLVHPESLLECIFLSPTYVDHFIGVPQAESDELLQYLVDHMLQPRYIYKHTWAVNDAILWDNRRFLHAALGNTIDQPRRGLRTTLAGPLRTGRMFDADASVSDLPVLND